MNLVVWINSLALLILNLSLLAWIKLRWPDSAIGSVINTIV